MSLRDLHYRLVDVFSEHPFEGNAHAIFRGAAGLSGSVMQQVARELNLATIAFITPATRDDCVAQLRVFTPLHELRFAGGPTIGSAFVLVDEGLLSRKSDTFRLETGLGPLSIRIGASGRQPMFWLRTPPIQSGPCYDADLCAHAVSLDVGDLLAAPPQWFSVSNPIICIAVRDQTVVDRARINLGGMKKLLSDSSDPTSIVVFSPTGDGNAYSRMFAPEYGVEEVPASGGVTGSLAMFMMHHGMAPSSHGTRFVVEQGTKMGRRSLLHVHVRGDSGSDSIEVGGYTTNVGTGYLSLDL